MASYPATDTGQAEGSIVSMTYPVNLPQCKPCVFQLTTPWDSTEQAAGTGAGSGPAKGLRKITIEIKAMLRDGTNCVDFKHCPLSTTTTSGHADVEQFHRGSFFVTDADGRWQQPDPVVVLGHTCATPSQSESGCSEYRLKMKVSGIPRYAPRKVMRSSIGSIEAERRRTVIVTADGANESNGVEADSRLGFQCPLCRFSWFGRGSADRSSRNGLESPQPQLAEEELDAHFAVVHRDEAWLEYLGEETVGFTIT